MPDVKDLVQISSNLISQCPHCSSGWSFTDPPSVAERAAHFIKQHGYKLLHVGQETVSGSDGPWQTTVAVLGK